MTERTAGSEYVCGWVAEDDCAPKLSAAFESGDDARIALAQQCVDVAAELLYGLSGRQYGLCEVTVRPCVRDCSPCSGTLWKPYLGRDGEWRNARCGGGDRCCKACDLRLPGPVHSVVDVLVDGLPVTTDEYRVDNKRFLTRTRARVSSNEWGPAEPPGAQWHLIDPSGGTGGPGQAISVSGGSQSVLQADGTVRANQDADLLMNQPSGRRGTRVLLNLDPYDRVQVPEDWEIIWTEPLGPGVTVFRSVGSGPDGRDEAAGGQYGGRVMMQGLFEAGLPGNAPISSSALFEHTGTGYVIEETSYVDTSRVTDDLDCWPSCQNMALSPDMPGTFAVTYLRGRPLPVAGRRAVAALAEELCLACLGDSCCSLPARVTNIVREGISMAMLDPMDFLDSGRTGIYLVDLWLKVVNPRSRVRPAAIYSPDASSSRKTTWP